MRLYSSILKWLVRFGWGLAGVIVTGLYLYYLRSQSLPDLQFWHQQDVAAELVPELGGLADENFSAYLAHEEKIFSQLDEAIGKKVPNLPTWHRYNKLARRAYQASWPEGNRSRLRTPDIRVGAALLVHGLSDSTHSMTALADGLLGAGFATLNLRIPGHGTLPGALLNVGWRHYRAAYLLGIRTLVEELAPGEPLILVGYSNGAALAVDYALQASAEGSELRRPDLLVLLSPAVQVSPVAAYARIQRRISELPGMGKLGWTDIVPEFDPFKYNSFPVYAGEQIYHLTSRIKKNLERLSPADREGFPRILAFQSVVDATISPRTVVEGLFEKLGTSSGELVLFDINRNQAVLPLLKNPEDTLLRKLLARPALSFDLTVVGNNRADPRRVSIKHRRQGESGWQETATDMHWPSNVFSLSHVALPFPADDPLYGPDTADGVIRLGDLWLKGERGVLGVPLGLLARQRYNPFYSYMEERIIATATDMASELCEADKRCGPEEKSE